MKRPRLGLSGMIVVLTLILSTQVAAAQGSLVLPRIFLPALSYAEPPQVTPVEPQPEWTAKWWQWIASLNNGPLWEMGPVDCSRGQSGDVWFLAGSQDDIPDGPPFVRQCTIPAGKTLLAPLQTAAWHNEGNENLSVEQKRTVLDQVYSDSVPGILNSKICLLKSSVNGNPIPHTRLQSPPFALLADAAAVSDGYWYAFQLGPGQHVVEFTGILCDFNTEFPLLKVDIIYELLVTE